MISCNRILSAATSRRSLTCAVFRERPGQARRRTSSQASAERRFVYPIEFHSTAAANAKHTPLEGKHDKCSSRRKGEWRRMTEGEAHETAQSEGCAKQRPAGLNSGRNIVIGDTERRPTPVIKSAETLHTQNRPCTIRGYWRQIINILSCSLCNFSHSLFIYV